VSTGVVPFREYQSMMTLVEGAASVVALLGAVDTSADAEQVTGRVSLPTAVREHVLKLLVRLVHR
jgi:hypothetical protein